MINKINSKTKYKFKKNKSKSKFTKKTFTPLKTNIYYKKLISQEMKIARSLGKGYGGQQTIKQEIKSCLTLLQKKPNILIDIGAHKGLYTKEILNFFPDVESYLFEPSSTNIKILNKIFYKYKNIHIIDKALSNKSGKEKLYYDAEGSALSSLTKRRLEHFDINMNDSEEIETIRFDEYWNKINNNKNKQNIDYVKIDVEGHELDVLEGFGNLLNKVNIIQFEFGGANIDTRTYFQDFWYFFKDKGFSLYRITPSGLLKITKYREIEEIFITTNYIAVNNKIKTNIDN